MGSESGTIQGTVNRMVEEEILVKGPPTDPRYRASFKLAEEFLADLRAAERAARTKESGAGLPMAAPREVYGGQRLLLIGGERLDAVIGALRRSSIGRQAEWIARVDGGNQRLLIALPDDGLVADRVEAEVRNAQGTVSQVRIDQFVEMTDLSPLPGDE